MNTAGIREMIAYRRCNTDRPTNVEATQRHHRNMLMISFGVVVAAFLLEVVPDQRVALVGLASYPFPHTCMSRSLFGTDCPGCGLTRSLIHLCHGNWRASLEVHRLGWLMGVAVLLQFPYRSLRLAKPGYRPLNGRIPIWFGRALIALLIANWSFNVVRDSWGGL